jgi:hypothetical protein
VNEDLSERLKNLTKEADRLADSKPRDVASPKTQPWLKEVLSFVRRYTDVTGSTPKIDDWLEAALKASESNDLGLVESATGRLYGTSRGGLLTPELFAKAADDLRAVAGAFRLAAKPWQQSR